MYQLVEMEDTVRVPPNELARDPDAVVRELVWRTFEGRLAKDKGFLVVATDVEREGPGRVIHGDGAVYQRVKFKALTFKPEVGEVVDGTVVEVAEFGAFVRFGPLDGLLHMSQIMNDFLNVDIGGGRLVGKETGRTLGIGDKVRARLVTVSLNEASPRESRIGLTMRQPGLGKHDWIEEDRAGGPPKREGAGGGRRGGGGRGTGGGGARGPPRERPPATTPPAEKEGSG